jgi:CHAT domain-containing protein
VPRLPFSRREAAAVTALAPAGQALSALDFAASRATATSDRLRDYRIVHFASHGLLDLENPELSGIVLSLVDEEGRPQDGFLRLAEVYGLRLRADLVVLSGCQTGLGRQFRGEGLVGLSRGFLNAGAARVVASLWKVDDRATAELMRRFYRAVLGAPALPPAAALREAQLAMAREERWAHPFHWAGFVLQGEWR